MNPQERASIKISCAICHKVFSLISFHTHYQRMHEHSQTNYIGFAKRASEISSLKQKKKKEQATLIYLKNPKLCAYCSAIISYEKRNATFCSSYCAAKHNSPGRTGTGPRKGSLSAYMGKHRKIWPCSICKCVLLHEGTSYCKGCEEEALKRISLRKKDLLKKRAHERMSRGWNPNDNRSRAKRSYLERSFEEWLIKMFPHLIYHTEAPFRRVDEQNKYCCTYYTDFYFPSLKLVIELDGTQHQYTREKDALRDSYISENYNLEIIRISSAEYLRKSRMAEIEKRLAG